MLLCWKGKQSKLIVSGSSLGSCVSTGSRAGAKSTNLGNYLWIKIMEASLSMDVTYTAPSELGSCRWPQLFQESLQDRKWSHLEVSVPHWHLVSSSVRTSWAKSRSGTTCSHLAWAVFNYTWYRHYTGTAHNDLIQGRRKKAEWEQPCKARGEECWVGTGLF